MAGDHRNDSTSLDDLFPELKKLRESNSSSPASEDFNVSPTDPDLVRKERESEHGIGQAGRRITVCDYLCYWSRYLSDLSCHMFIGNCCPIDVCWAQGTHT